MEDMENDMNKLEVDADAKSPEQLEEERLELQQRLDNTMTNLSMVRDEKAKEEALVACRQAFMSMADNSMEKFGMPADFSDTRILLDWADLIIEKFT